MHLFPWLNSSEMSLHILRLESIASLPFVKVALYYTPMNTTESSGFLIMPLVHEVLTVFLIFINLKGKRNYVVPYL